MRGGFFPDSYKIDSRDFLKFISEINKDIFNHYSDTIRKFPENLHIDEFNEKIVSQNNNCLSRIWMDYLPLTFSRRHGDPSRPWNVFSIETENNDGSARLDYQGNWRDIFQNWEALCLSYPLFLDHVIAKFLNSTTIDGYNPYRISRSGIDWEKPSPGDPWANIGYWNDHQIIYLLKLLEMHYLFFLEKLISMLDDKLYSTSDVPYEIVNYRFHRIRYHEIFSFIKIFI